MTLPAERDELLAPMQIKAIEFVYESAASKADVNAHVGKAGGDLPDTGFYPYFLNLETMEFRFIRGVAFYDAVPDGKIPDAIRNNYSEKGIRNIPVKSMTFEGVGDATAYEL